MNLTRLKKFLEHDEMPIQTGIDLLDLSIAELELDLAEQREYRDKLKALQVAALP